MSTADAACQHRWVRVGDVWGRLKGWQCWFCGKWWEYTGAPPYQSVTWGCSSRSVGERR